MTVYLGRLKFDDLEIKLTSDLLWESDGHPASDEMVDYLQTEAFLPPNDYSFADGDEGAWMLNRAAELIPYWKAEVFTIGISQPRDLKV